MKPSKYLLLVVVIGLLLSPLASMAGIIKATADLAANSVAKGQQITVPVTIDLSNLPEKLGSFTAVLNWDAQVLKYMNSSAGSAAGFSNPVVNADKASQGKLVFAAANPRGAEGKLTVLNVAFEIVGSEGSSCSLDLEFSAMAAAYTFADLLPYVETVTTGVKQELTVKQLPEKIAIDQNYPNPFNPTTEISYQLPKADQVYLAIYNLLGQKIRTLVNEMKEAGSYNIYWDGKDDSGKDVPAGIYMYRIQVSSFTDMKKMMLVK